MPAPLLVAAAGAAVVLVAAAGGLPALGDPARRLPATLSLLAVASAAWAAACLLAERVAPRLSRRSAAAAVLAVAALVRLPLLALPPTLSDDLLRYLWDGRVAAAGANPYALAPDAAELAPLRDDLWQRLPHRQVPTVYPPLALVGFSIAAALPRPVLAWKAIATAVDLAGCAALLALGRRRGLPAARAAWYAWSPLVALEVAGMGHVDALGVTAAVVAVLALSPKSAAEGAGGDRRGSSRGSDEAGEPDRTIGPDADRGGRLGDAERPQRTATVVAERPRESTSRIAGGERRFAAEVPAPSPAGRGRRLAAGRRSGRAPSGAGRSPSRAAVLAAGAAAAAGALAKLAPIAALPLWARVSRRPALFLAVAGGLLLGGLMPVVAAVGGVPPGLVVYGVSWEFAGPLYEPLWRLLDAGGVDRAAAALLDRFKAATGWHDGPNRLYPLLYPQLLAKLLLAAGAAAVLLGSLRDRDPVAGSRRLFGGLLVCSATVYPWYLLWVLPWAALGRRAPWLVAAALAPLLYLPQHAGVELFPGVWAAVWGPPALLAAIAARRARRAAR